MKQNVSVERIRLHSQNLTNVADSYARLCNLATKADADKHFVELVDAIGQESCSSLSRLGTVLKMCWQASRTGEE